MGRKKQLDPTQLVVNAIANLQDHGASCGCSTCEQDRAAIAANPETAAVLSKLVR